jgi:hypothetical protein
MVTRELAGAGDTATGQVNPESASGRAILAVQQASQAPMTEQKESYKNFIEDIAKIDLEYLVVYSEDGVNMEDAFSEPDPVTIKRPAIISTWYESAVAGEPLPMHITTNLDMNYLELYEGSTLLASWTTENADIVEYATCKDWNVTYTFETAGEHHLWYKATSDGVTEEIPYGDAEPVIIGENVSAELVIGDFTYAYNSGKTGVIVKKYSGTAASVVVPAVVEGLPVVEIGASAFEGNTELVAIDLPDTIEVIGARAFANCTNLSSMN